MPFNDQDEAGQKLAKALSRYRNQEPAIFALIYPAAAFPWRPCEHPRCASRSRPGPQDRRTFSARIGHGRRHRRRRPSFVDGGAPLIVRNEDVIESASIGDRELKAVCNRELAEIERRRRRYLGSRERVDVAGCTAIVVDDGIATGATMQAALRATLMRNPKRLVLAVPGAPTSRDA